MAVRIDLLSVQSGLNVEVIPPPELVRFLELAWDQRATDLILTPGNHPLFRLQGHLLPVRSEPQLTAAFCTALAQRFMPEEYLDKLIDEREIDFSFAWEENARFRVNVFRQRGSFGLVLRIIPHGDLSVTLGTPVSQADARTALGLGKGKIALMFGAVEPYKGQEEVIAWWRQSMPA